MEQSTCEVKGEIDNSMRAVVARIAIQSDSIDTVQRWLEEYPRNATRELVTMAVRVPREMKQAIEVFILNLADLVLLQVSRLPLGQDRDWAVRILFDFLRGCLLESVYDKSEGVFLRVLNK